MGAPKLEDKGPHDPCCWCGGPFPDKKLGESDWKWRRKAFCSEACRKASAKMTDSVSAARAKRALKRKKGTDLQELDAKQLEINRQSDAVLTRLATGVLEPSFEVKRRHPQLSWLFGS